MSDQTSNPVPVVQFTEQLPAQAGGISAIASANAPFIYLEAAATFGYSHGIIQVTLEALRYLPIADKVLLDRVIVGHLRMSLHAANELRAALDRAIDMAASPKDATQFN